MCQVNPGFYRPACCKQVPEVKIFYIVIVTNRNFIAMAYLIAGKLDFGLPT
jgi:hypothetical protein